MLSGTLVYPESSLTLMSDGFCSGGSPRWFEGLLWFAEQPCEAVRTASVCGSMTTLPLPGHTPSGLGFGPDGSLLIASAEDRQILRYDGETVITFADLSDIVPAELGDMVVDELGRAYVGCRAHGSGLEGGLIVRVDPNAAATVVADGLACPDGMAITADRKTLIVAESIGRRLTAFSIDPDGMLSDRRVFAEHLDGPPLGIALDADGGVWTSLTLAHQFQRIVAGGEVTDCIDIGNRTAIACTLGGARRRVLFLLSSVGASPLGRFGPAQARIDAVTVDVPGAGVP
jgi:sugar lactone lactonase YvrE